MRIFRQTCIRLIVCQVAFAVSVYAGQVYVEKATGGGVSDADLTNATELVKSAVGDVSSNSVVDQPNQADLILRPKLLHLGAAYILTLSKIRDGQTIYSSQLKAEKIDELDKVAERLTRSVLAGKRAADTPRVGEITNQEEHDGTQRRPARHAVYLGFGGANFQNLNSSGVGYSFGLAYSWDVNRARIKLMGEGDVNGAAFFASAGLGGNYFLTMEDLAPYLSLDFGAGVAKLDGGGVLSGQTVGGFVVGTGAGLEMLRTSAISVDLGFRMGFLFHSTVQGTPAAFTLRLGLYF